MAAGVGVQRLLAGGEGIKQREARVARHQLVVPLQQELTGTVTRAAASARVSWPAKPKTAAVILGSAATNGTPIALPSDTPQNPTGPPAPT